MNRSSFFFLGIFAALVASWVGGLLANKNSYGGLTPIVDAEMGGAYPAGFPGIAHQGQAVYQDLGCAACHTQQVRRPGFGIDDKRGWGEHQSVARSYIFEPTVLLGSLRVGPDLRNVGQRKDGQEGRDGREWHYKHLYNPQLTSPGSVMPAFPFLFETRPIIGQPAANAIQRLLPADAQPPAGHEIVPTGRADALVTYLMSLKDNYAYPEIRNVYVAAPAANAQGEAPKAEGAHK